MIFFEFGFDFFMIQKKILNVLNTIIMDASILTMGIIATIDEFNGFSKSESAYAGKCIVYLFLVV